MIQEDLITLLEKLIEEWEHETVEFKQAGKGFSSHDIGKYFSALANEANLLGKDCGWLVFGVHNKTRQVISTDYREKAESLEALKHEISEHLEPRLSFQSIQELDLPEGRVILFQIPPSPVGFPTSWKGHYYARNGESLDPLGLDKIDKIRAQSQQADWSALTCPKATIDDLSDEAISLAREKYTEKNTHLKDQINSWDTPTFLNKAKLTIEGKITNTALILLGKPESSHHLHPAVSQITWILKDKDGIEKDYAHFHSPLLLAVDEVYQRIRKIKYRYMVTDSLFPEEVEQYSPYLIREALNNAIAHQDYTKGGRVVMVENESDSLIFVNEGDFLPGSVEEVIRADAPSTYYRNRYLVEAMVNLKLIDTIGSGIKKMFALQKSKLFPMPEYDFSDGRVTLTIYGKVLDLNYARKLAQMPDIRLEQIMLLDKVQKKKPLTNVEIQELKKGRFIEGRKPNFYISANVAAQTEQTVDYMKQRGIENDYLKEMILKSLKNVPSLKLKQFEEMFSAKLSDVLSEQQKKKKISNALQELRREGKLESGSNYEWRLKSS